MRIAIWQGHSPRGDRAAALQVIAAALQAAGAMGAAVLVTPEVFLPGYNQPDPSAGALAPDDPVFATLSALCRTARCGLVLGFAEAGAHLFNTAIALDADGVEIARYRKIQLYGPREKALYHPGDRYCIFDLNGTKTALLICYDIEFAPHVAALAAQGVTLILVPTANMEPYTYVIRHTIPAMAAHHGVAIAYANYCGVEGDLTYLGGSLIAGPHGEVLAQAGQHPALLIADLPPPDPTRLSTQSSDLRKIPHA